MFLSKPFRDMLFDNEWSFILGGASYVKSRSSFFADSHRKNGAKKPYGAARHAS